MIPGYAATGCSRLGSVVINRSSASDVEAHRKMAAAAFVRFESAALGREPFAQFSGIHALQPTTFLLCCNKFVVVAGAR